MFAELLDNALDTAREFIHKIYGGSRKDIEGGFIDRDSANLVGNKRRGSPWREGAKSYATGDALVERSQGRQEERFFERFGPHEEHVNCPLPLAAQLADALNFGQNFGRDPFCFIEQHDRTAARNAAGEKFSQGQAVLRFAAISNRSLKFMQETLDQIMTGSKARATDHGHGTGRGEI